MKDIKVGLIGFGTIGTGVVKIFQNNAQLLERRLGARLTLARIVDLDITTDRGVTLAPKVLSSNIGDILDDPEIDVVIELIGGYEPARTFVLRAIENGKSIVTANKALLALHGDEIFAAAARKGVDVLFEAAVGGGIPIISSIKQSLCANNFSEVVGILNGTCNYILTSMTDDGEEFSDVLRDAQAKGYAESDPTFDIEGVDTAHKIALLIALCFGTRVRFEDIHKEGISGISGLDIQFASLFGYKIKLLAIGKMTDGQIEARVHPTMVPLDYPLADVNGVFNAVRLVGDFVGEVTLHGAGAGMDATASAVMGDVMTIARSIGSGGALSTPPMAYRPESIVEIPMKPMSDIVSQYYLRFTGMDKPGVLAKIAGVLGKYDISIASMIQPERGGENSVPIVLMTHEAREANVLAALEEIDALDAVQEKSRLIRIEGEGE